MRELDDIREKNKRKDLLMQGMEEVPVFNGNINDCEEWELINSLKCEHYEEDEWGICKQKLDWKNKSCKNNCHLKLSK